MNESRGKAGTTRSLTGYWAYTIQGHMQSVNPHNSIAESPKILEVGLAFRDDPVLHELHVSYPDLPMVPLTTWSLPPLPVAGKPAPALQAGYMPFTESGYMRFAPDGTVSGRLWFTIAGTTNYPMPFHSHGRYAFDDAVNDQGIVLPAGAISLQFDNFPPSDAFPGGFNLSKFLWDYTFIMTSNDEIYLATAGRYPRPAIASGTLKAMQEAAFHPPKEHKTLALDR